MKRSKKRSLDYKYKEMAKKISARGRFAYGEKKTINQLLRDAEKYLRKRKITSARLDAEVILCFVLAKPREWLYAHSENQLTNSRIQRFGALIKKRAGHYPVAYITNQKEFFGLNFFVNQNVLIPRPETELLVETAFDIIEHRTGKLVIADIGTGSGCLAIAIAKNVKRNLTIYAIDISAPALANAKKNAERHQVLSKIKFYRGNLLKPVRNKKLDVLVANLPYLDSKTENLLRSSDSKALKFEPRIALFGVADGLNPYRELFEQISALDRPPRFILLEIGQRQTNRIKKIIEQTLPSARIEIIKDLAGRDRVVKIEC